METNNPKIVILVILQFILFIALTWFTVFTVSTYSRNITFGTNISIGIILVYLFILYQSIVVFKKGRVGLAYFLSILFFLLLSFVQFINCAHSFTMH